MNQRRAEHDLLRNCMLRFLQILDAPGPVDLEQLLKERLFFAQVFSSHLLHENAQVDGETSSGSIGETPARFRQWELGSMRGDYSVHVNYWTPARITADRIGYRDAVVLLQERLFGFMAWEEANLPIYCD